MTYAGQSLRAESPASSFLNLSQMAIEFPRRRSAMSEARSAAGLSQGIAVEHHKGRVVVLGEAATLTSQVTKAGSRTLSFGMSRSGINNRQLALNIMHWLTKLLN